MALLVHLVHLVRKVKVVLLDLWDPLGQPVSLAPKAIRDPLVNQVSREEMRLERKVTRVMPVALVTTESLDHQEIKVLLVHQVPKDLRESKALSLHRDPRVTWAREVLTVHQVFLVWMVLLDLLDRLVGREIRVTVV